MKNRPKRQLAKRREIKQRRNDMVEYQAIAYDHEARSKAILTEWKSSYPEDFQQMVVEQTDHTNKCEQLLLALENKQNHTIHELLQDKFVRLAALGFDHRVAHLLITVKPDIWGECEFTLLDILRSEMFNHITDYVTHSAFINSIINSLKHNDSSTGT